MEDLDLFDLESLLSDEDRLVRSHVRHWVSKVFTPRIKASWDAATFPVDLVPELAALGVFGGNINGYKRAGASLLLYRYSRR